MIWTLLLDRNHIPFNKEFTKPNLPQIKTYKTITVTLTALNGIQEHPLP